MKNSYFPLLILLWMVTSARCSDSGAQDAKNVPDLFGNNTAEIISGGIATSLEHYGQWISDRNSDPSPPFSGQSRLYGQDSGFEIEFILRNHIVTGHSDVTPSECEVMIEVAKKFLGVGVASKAHFSGDYLVNGTLRGNVRFNGTGKFSTSFSSKYLKEMLLFTSFEISGNETNKYINLASLANTNYFFSQSDESGVQFRLESIISVESAAYKFTNQNFTARGLELVKQQFPILYQNYFFNHAEEHPSAILLQKYFKQVLREVSLAQNKSQAEQPSVVVEVKANETTPVENKTSPQIDQHAGKVSDPNAKEIKEELVAPDHTNHTLEGGNHTHTDDHNQGSSGNHAPHKVLGNDLMWIVSVIVMFLI